MQEKFTAQPIGVWCFTPIRLTGARDRVPKKTYVRATGYDYPNFERAYAKEKAAICSGGRSKCRAATRS